MTWIPNPPATSLRAVTLGVAMGDVSHEVQEVGGNNQGPRVAWYLQNAGISIPAPWCAAAVQGWADIAAQLLQVPNPLDAVAREALVLDYYTRMRDAGLLVPPDQALPGDLAFFDFRAGGNSWDHIGLVLTPPDPTGVYRTIEGNTGDRSQRDGDGVFVKGRRIGAGYDTAFARWAA